MITNTHSWSLGLSSRSLAKEEATPNKSLDQFGALICSHSQSDRIGAAKPASPCFQAFCILTSAFCIGQIHLPGDRHQFRASVLDHGPARSGSSFPLFWLPRVFGRHRVGTIIALASWTALALCRCSKFYRKHPLPSRSAASGSFRTKTHSVYKKTHSTQRSSEPRQCHSNLQSSILNH